MVDISPHPLQAQISALKVEHQQVKDIIQELESSQNFNSLALKRYKKKKLCLKDSIHKLENDMLPDIIAWNGAEWFEIISGFISWFKTVPPWSCF